MLGFQGPARPSPTLGDAINAGFGYLEVKCLGCNTHQTVALDIVRRPGAASGLRLSHDSTERGGRADPSEGHAGDPDDRRGTGRVDARAMG
jgi:hypothetical protein